MIKLNMLFKYMVRYIALVPVVFLLSGCLGGTVAQQIVRSIATSVADKTMAHAMDVEDGPSNRTSSDSNTQASAVPGKESSQVSTVHSNSLLQPHRPANAQPTNQDLINKNLASQNLEKINLAKRSLQEMQANPYNIAIANTAFKQVKPEDLKPIAEPLPIGNADVESPIQVIQSNQLVAVELFNLLIGEEKNAVYEQARLIGCINLPQKREWQHWSVATGAIKASHHQPTKKIITFLIPPEFGKLHSGTVTMVELASPGELNVARYKAN